MPADSRCHGWPSATRSTCPGKRPRSARSRFRDTPSPRCSKDGVWASPSPIPSLAEPIVDAAQQRQGAIVRRHRALIGEVECVATRCGEGAYTLRVRVANRRRLPSEPLPRNGLLPHSLVSVHTILTVVRGEGQFISLTDPPAALGNAAAACRNVRTWPVLVGGPGEARHDPLLTDHHRRLSRDRSGGAGDLFDGTEIDEILSLRIMTLTDAEQREMSQTDERARLLSSAPRGSPPTR